MSARLSFANLVAAATLTASSAAAEFPATNAKTPQRPFLPWRTAALGTQSLVIDFGAAQAVNLVALIAANFTDATVQGNATDAWGAPSYAQAVTLARNRVNTRYHYALLPVGFNYRYLRILIAAQTPTDGAAFYRLGGVWAATDATAPPVLTWSPSITTLVPRADVGPAHRGWSQRLLLGEPRAVVDASLMAEASMETPGVGDEFATWSELLRRAWAADVFLYAAGLGDASAVWPMRQQNDPAWRIEAGHADASWILEEVLGP